VVGHRCQIVGRHRYPRLGFVALVAATLLAVGCGAPTDGRTNTASPKPAVDVSPTHATRAEPATAAASTRPVGAPGVPAVHVMSNLGANTCRVSWTPPADEGGSPIVDYGVTTESPSTPTDRRGVDVGTAIQTARTTATYTDVGIGFSVAITAENAAGPGAAARVTCSR
jgi:hypothetical protein